MREGWSQGQFWIMIKEVVGGLHVYFVRSLHRLVKPISLV